MSEPARRSALEDHYRIGRFGARAEDAPGVVLAERRPCSMVQVNGAPEPGALAGALGASDADVSPNRTFDAGGVRYAWNGPDQWLAESDEHGPRELVEHVEGTLRAHGASTTDLSHARTAVRVSGPAANGPPREALPHRRRVHAHRRQRGDHGRPPQRPDREEWGRGIPPLRLPQLRARDVGDAPATRRRSSAGEIVPAE